MVQTDKLKDACTTDAQDRGLTIVAGTAVTGDPIGLVYWDTNGDGRYVLRVGKMEHLPDDMDDMAELLAGHGWRLTPDSRREVFALQPAERQPPGGTSRATREALIDPLGVGSNITEMWLNAFTDGPERLYVKVRGVRKPVIAVRRDNSQDGPPVVVLEIEDAG